MPITPLHILLTIIHNIILCRQHKQLAQPWPWKLLVCFILVIGDKPCKIANLKDGCMTTKITRLCKSQVDFQRRFWIEQTFQCNYTTVAQEAHVHYQFQRFQLPILDFLVTNFQFGYFSLPIWNFLISDFQCVYFFLPNLDFLFSNMPHFLLPILTYPILILAISTFTILYHTTSV